VSDKACPICGERMAFNPRYPRQVCRVCVERACDEEGRPLRFYNTSLSGGFLARYADSGKDRNSHVCFIDGVRCWADETHMGGIAVQVATEDRPLEVKSTGFTKLTRCRKIVNPASPAMKRPFHLRNSVPTTRSSTRPTATRALGRRENPSGGGSGRVSSAPTSAPVISPPMCAALSIPVLMKPNSRL